MKQRTLLKVFFLLFVLIVGSGSAFGQVASVAPANNGSYVVAAYVNGKYYALPCTTTNGGTLAGVEISLNAGNKVNTSTASGKTWTLEEGSGNNAGKYYLKYTNGNNTYYLYKNGTSTSNNNFKVSTGDKNYWSFTANGTGYTVAAVDRGSNHLNIQCNGGTFRCYSTATAIRLLEVGDVATHTLNFSATNGTITITNGTTPVTSGSQVAEGAALNVSASANTGYSFSTWTKDAGTFADASSASTTFTMPTSDATIGATFTLNTHALDLSGTNGTFETTVDGEDWDGSSEIPYGSTVSITANANTNYAFQAWDTTLDSYSATDNPLVFTMPDDDVAVSASFVSADTEYNINISGSIINGSVEADKSKAKAGVTVTLTPTPNSGYAFYDWNVVDASSNVITVTNNQFTMPANNVTVSATFKKVHTITYVIGNDIDETTRLDGETLNIPVSTTGFAGWTDDNTDVTPSISNDVTVTGDMEIYAVFASGYGTPTYNKVTSTAGVTAGQYLIVYESDKIVFDGSLATLDAGGITKSVSTAYTTGTITASDAIDAMNFTLAVYDGGFSIKSASGKYIGNASASNGLTASDSELKNTISISSGNAAIAGTGGYHLRFNSSSGSGSYRFRYYSSTSQKDIQLYKRQNNVTYSLSEYEAINISAAGWATYATKSDVEFTDGEAYVVVAADDDENTTTIKSVTEVPAGTPVLMKGTSGSAVVKYAEVLSSTPAAPASNYLHIVGAGETINEASGVYVLANKANGVGFYPWTGTALAEGKIYLQLPAGAKMSDFFAITEAEETDGIRSIENGKLNIETSAFNLAGQKVDGAYKGIVIVNGKKVVRK